MTWILGWTVSLFAFIKAQLVILLLHVLSAGPIPRHVAFEMDGNRRFARLTGRRAVEGHSDGFHTLKRVHPGSCCSYGDYLTWATDIRDMHAS
jgi:ditrans,polycis-polyprenyl diphosphate synthase